MKLTHLQSLVIAIQSAVIRLQLITRSMQLVPKASLGYSVDTAAPKYQHKRILRIRWLWHYRMITLYRFNSMEKFAKTYELTVSTTQKPCASNSSNSSNSSGTTVTK